MTFSIVPETLRESPLIIVHGSDMDKIREALAGVEKHFPEYWQITGSLEYASTDIVRRVDATPSHITTEDSPAFWAETPLTVIISEPFYKIGPVERVALHHIIDKGAEVGVSAVIGMYDSEDDPASLRDPNTLLLDEILEVGVELSPQQISTLMEQQ